MSAYYPDVALTGGSWQPSGAVMRWVADDPYADAPELDMRLLVACPTCRAAVDQTCRTRSGHTTTPHGSRLAPRLCRCGAQLGWHRRMCDPCRDASLQASKNEWAERKRASRARRKDAA